jgi:hypothetical protein
LCDCFRAVLDQDLQQLQRFPGYVQRLIVPQQLASIRIKDEVGKAYAHPLPK